MPPHLRRRCVNVRLFSFRQQTGQIWEDFDGFFSRIFSYSFLVFLDVSWVLMLLCAILLRDLKMVVELINWIIVLFRGNKSHYEI